MCKVLYFVFFYVKLQLDILLTLLLYEYFLTCLKKIIFEKTFSFLKIITFDMYTFFVKILYNIAEIKLGIWHADVFSSALRSFLSINLPIFSFKHCFNQKSLMGSQNTLTLLPVPQKQIVRKTYFQVFTEENVKDIRIFCNALHEKLCVNDVFFQ